MVTFNRLRELAGIQVLCEKMSQQQAKQVFAFYGVEPANDPRELKSQFHKLAQVNHPDRGGSVDAMQEINAAYEVLKAEGTTTAPSEEIRRKPGQAFEDFSDAEYWKRRLETIGGGSAMPCTVFAFDGREFTASIEVKAYWDEKSREMIYEGMMAHSKYAKVIGVLWKHEPKKFVVVYADQKPQYVAYPFNGWMGRPQTDQKLVTGLANKYKK